MHHQHLRVGAVLFDGKGQRIFDLIGNVRRRLPGVVLDAARPAGDVLFAVALRILLFDHGSGICRAGVLAQKRHEIVLDAAGWCLHRFRRGRGRRFFRQGRRFRGGFGLLLLRRLLPHLNDRLHSRQRRRDERRQHQHSAAGEDAQRREQGGGFQKGDEMPRFPHRQRGFAAHGSGLLSCFLFLLYLCRSKPFRTAFTRSTSTAAPH